MIFKNFYCDYFLYSSQVIGMLSNSYCRHFPCRIVRSFEKILTDFVQNENFTIFRVSTPNLAFVGERVSHSVMIKFVSQLIYHNLLKYAHGR